MSHWSWQWTRVIHKKQLWGKPHCRLCNHLCQWPRCKTRGPIKYGRSTQRIFIFANMVLSPWRAHFIYLFKQEVAQQTSYKNGGFKLEVMAYIIIIVLKHGNRDIFSVILLAVFRQRLSLCIYLLYFTCSEMATLIDFFFSSTFLFNS